MGHKFLIVHHEDEAAEMSNCGMWTEEDYLAYVEKHGQHFTDELAEYASSLMENADGSKHSWKVPQVVKTLASLGITHPAEVTDGDMTYAANMAYADFYPDPLKDEVACLKLAGKMANDPDGYTEMIFSRWTGDIAHKHVKIDWKQFT